MIFLRMISILIWLGEIDRFGKRLFKVPIPFFILQSTSLTMSLVFNFRSNCCGNQDHCVKSFLNTQMLRLLDHQVVIHSIDFHQHPNLRKTLSLTSLLNIFHGVNISFHSQWAYVVLGNNGIDYNKSYFSYWPKEDSMELPPLKQCFLWIFISYAKEATRLEAISFYIAPSL